MMEITPGEGAPKRAFAELLPHELALQLARVDTWPNFRLLNFWRSFSSTEES
jgi:hypothetical protein